mmetsp:Transcript_52080/g.121087  ORF Transcript_52080/g.121087 Transcript_52080/m.121087 type:complete len:398 (-) Transcript_52080:124-1317(-)
MAPANTWSQWIADLGRIPGDAYSSFIGSDYKFPSNQGLLVVHEQGLASHAGAVRARCTTSGKEYELRRLQAGTDAGGLVALGALEAMERQASLAMKAGDHAHSLRCHAALIENKGGSHCRLLLCDPCITDLRAHLTANDSKLPVPDIIAIGQQLAFGLGHLHSLCILFGSMAPTGIFCGRDGLWKLGSFERSAQLPLTVGEWRDQCRDAGHPLSSVDETPPEARRSSDNEVRPEADVWLLGRFLATTLLSEASGAVAEGEGGACVVSASVAELQDTSTARLWLLLHWLLAVDPVDRPNANETAALISTVCQTLPRELLEEMPRGARRHCSSAAVAAARQVALDEAVRAAADAAEHDRLVRRLAGLPLASLRRELSDASLVDRLCHNCGVTLDEAAES